MSPTLTELDREWLALATSSASSQALLRWSQAEPALDGLPILAAVLDERRDDAVAPVILAALARLAAHDQQAARTLLQAMLPGMARMASTGCSGRPSRRTEGQPLRARSASTRRGAPGGLRRPGQRRPARTAAALSRRHLTERRPPGWARAARPSGSA